MWLLVLITLINAVANNKTFLDHRFSIGIMPVNLIDVLLVIGTCYALVRIKSPRNFAFESVHPALLWTIGLFIAGVFCGFLGAVTNGAVAYDIINPSRNFLTLPACILMGYALLPRLRSARWMTYWHVIGGVLTAAMILLFFRGQIDIGAGEKDVNMLRTINYITTYPGTAALFLVFTVLVGVRLVPTILSLPLAAFMIAGQFATLSRSEWVASILGLGASMFFLPRERRARGLGLFLVSIIVLGSALGIGVMMTRNAGSLKFMENLGQKVDSLDPNSDTAKAWSTRVPALMEELRLWLESPLFGRGFGEQTVVSATVGAFGEGFNHNVWTSALCDTGLPGFAAMAMTVLICIVLGARMIRDRADRTCVIVGCLGVVSGLFLMIYGACTMSFNTERGAIPLGLIVGLVLRTRAMQLKTLSIYHEIAAAGTETSELVDAEGYVVPIDQLAMQYQQEVPLEY